MNMLITISMVLIFVSCKEKSAQVSAIDTNSIAVSQNDDKGTIELKFDDQTYNYDNIDWDFSTVKVNNDILIKIVQEGNPIIDFGFLASDQHLEKGNFNYTIPESKSAQDFLYLNFFDKKRNTKSHVEKRIGLISGQIEVKRTSNSIIINFDAIGSSMLDVSKDGQFPISGSILLKF